MTAPELLHSNKQAAHTEVQLHCKFFTTDPVMIQNLLSLSHPFCAYGQKEYENSPEEDQKQRQTALIMHNDACEMKSACSLLSLPWGGRYTNPTLRRCCSSSLKCPSRPSIRFISCSHCLNAGTSWWLNATLHHSFFPPYRPFLFSLNCPFDRGCLPQLWEHSCRNALVQPAHMPIKVMSIEQQGLLRSVQNRWPSSGDSVIQFWLCQGLEVMGTAGMRRLNRGIGVDRTGHCMEESNRYSMISILYPQRNCTINFFPHHHYGIGVNLLKQCFKKYVKKKKKDMQIFV